jgi:hypothetical protein
LSQAPIYTDCNSRENAAVAHDFIVLLPVFSRQSARAETVN